jgi:hypothetical protein
VHRALVGNFQHALALFGTQVAFERDVALDAIARDAVDLYFVVAQGN